MPSCRSAFKRNIQPHTPGLNYALKNEILNDLSVLYASLHVCVERFWAWLANMNLPWDASSDWRGLDGVYKICLFCLWVTVIVLISHRMGLLVLGRGNNLNGIQTRTVFEMSWSQTHSGLRLETILHHTQGTLPPLTCTSAHLLSTGPPVYSLVTVILLCIFLLYLKTIYWTALLVWNAL